MTFEIFATVTLALAVLHTFLVKKFQHLAHRYPEGSVGENFFHLLGEVEVVFGLWAAVNLVVLSFWQGRHEALHYLETRNFTEPAFVFVILVVCSTRPILVLAEKLIDGLSGILPLKPGYAFYMAALVAGPLLGSFITEPAAMTITALLLNERLYSRKISNRLKYATLGLLFVNVSIGGTLTHFAAPPVLMVASTWGWDLLHMLEFFGWKAVLAIVFSTTFTIWRFRNELGAMKSLKGSRQAEIPAWVMLFHLLFLAAIVLTAHHTVVFLFVFLFFLGLVTVTREFQGELKLKEGLLVGFFLAGLVIMGGHQAWWIQKILTSLGTTSLYLGAAALTAVTDNAALTYLGAQVQGLEDLAKYALVAGAVVGGGLTVIANAPNPAGYGILNPNFGDEGISALELLKAALLPTLIALIFFWPL